jgi:TM2 domain-containing membrane protein YozV
MFPGLKDLPRLEKLSWQCTDSGQAKTANSYMTFCKDAVRYNPALPSPNVSSAPMDQLVKAQDDAAATMFFYHMNGLGYEAWDHQEPHKSPDPCVRSTWRMVCFSLFPKAEAGCRHGEPSTYRRPCMGSCSDYLKACQVECCDESPKCVFEHSVQQTGDPGNASALQTGYVNAMGPSTLCTGGSDMSGSSRSISPSFLALVLAVLGLQLSAGAGEKRSNGGVAAAEPAMPAAKKASYSLTRWMVLGALVAVAISIQGCDADNNQGYPSIPMHSLGNWRKKPDYLVSYEYVPTGATPSQVSLNSCSLDLDLAATLQCSGRGYCKGWSLYKGDSISFCSCDRDYTDPECRTRRRSQTSVFLCAIFGGMFGLDYFYLGLPWWGLGKFLVTFFSAWLWVCGGLGSLFLTFGGPLCWWLVDIIRTGSGAVYAHDFRVSQDLPHWAYVLSVTALFMVAGLVISMESYFRHRKLKRHELLLMQQKADNRDFAMQDSMEFQQASMGESFSQPRSFAGYGTTVPAPLPNAGAPLVPSMQMAPPVYRVHA